MDSNGVLIPLETYMDRMDPTHQLSQLTVKLRAKRDLDEVSAAMLGRAKQAHHGIEDVEVKNLDAELARASAGLQSGDARLVRSCSSASPAPCSWSAASACSR